MFSKAPGIPPGLLLWDWCIFALVRVAGRPRIPAGFGLSQISGGAVKRILLASATLLALTAAQPAVAQPMPVFNWSGFYLGGFVGGAWPAGNAVTADPCLVGASCPVIGTYNGVAPVSYPLSSSFIGGGTVGVNWQAPASAFVLGLEGEVGFLRLSGSVVMNPLTNSDTVASTTIGDWYVAYTARLGLAWDRSLLYAKLGGVTANVSTGVVDANPAGLTLNTTTTTTVTGFAAGAGWEFAFAPNWSLKAEYLWLGLNKAIAHCGTTSLPSVTCSSTNLPNVHTAKVGVNYRW